MIGFLTAGQQNWLTLRICVNRKINHVVSLIIMSINNNYWGGKFEQIVAKALIVLSERNLLEILSTTPSSFCLLTCEQAALEVQMSVEYFAFLWIFPLLNFGEGWCWTWPRYIWGSRRQNVTFLKVVFKIHFRPFWVILGGSHT